jgi:hypothetical protein
MTEFGVRRFAIMMMFALARASWRVQSTAADGHQNA